MIGAPIAAIHCTVQVQDQTDVQVLGNTSGVGIGGVAPTWSFSTTPNVDLAASSGRWSFTLRYTPVLSMRTIESAPSVDLLQQGGLSLLWRTRRFRVTLNEQAAYGVLNYASAAATVPSTTGAAPTQQALPPNTTLLTASSRSTITLTQSLSRRLEGSIYAGWNVGGGADAVTRTILPLQRGPVGGAQLSYALTRVDALEARLDFTRLDFSEALCTSAPTIVGVTTTSLCTPRDDQASLTFGYRRRFMGATDVSLQGGVAASGVQSSEGKPYSVRAYPIAAAALTRRVRHLGSETTFRFSTQLTPIISQQTGAVDQRVGGEATLDWVSQRLFLHGQARASQSIPFDVAGAYFIANGEASVGLRFDRHVTISFGERADWQRYATGQSLVALMGFVRIQVASRVFRF